MWSINVSVNLILGANDMVFGEPVVTIFVFVSVTVVLFEENSK